MSETATDSSTIALADDRSTGLAMFVIFIVACLIVTGAGDCPAIGGGFAHGCISLK